MVCKFTTGGTITSGVDKVIYANNATNRDCPQLEIGSSNEFWFGVPQNASTWVRVAGVSNFPKTNTTYWLKGCWDNGTISSYYSTDGKTYTKIGSTALASYSWTKPPHFGVDITSSAFSGSIDLYGCYIKFNDKMVWTGMKSILI